MKTICLIGYYGAGNFGDELLLSQTKSLFQKIGSFHFKILASSNSESVQDLNVEYINKFSLTAVFFALLDSEALVFGGGSVFQNASSLKSLIYYFAICFFAKILGKKLVFLSQGIGPLNGALANVLTNWAFQLADYISIRDQYSLSIVSGWGLTAKYAPDLVWSLPLKKPIKQTKQTVIISLRPSKELKTENINSFIAYLEAKFANYKIYLCAFQACDEEILALIKNQIPSAEIINLNQNPDYINYFAQANLCFAMRFHAVLLAIKAQVPTIGIVYDPKVQTLCENANLPFIKAEELLKNNLDDLDSFLMPNSEQLMNFAQEQAEISEKNNNLILCSLCNF